MSTASAGNEDVVVSCARGDEGWTCDVRVGSDPAATGHTVRVAITTLKRLGFASDADPTGLVRASFGFLLEREPREAILGSFELSEVGRYFPEWESAIRNTPSS